MWPHFTGTIELGQLLIVLAVVFGAMRILTALDNLEMEHEMLIDDYCERKFPLLSTDEARKRLLTRRRRSLLAILMSGGRSD